MPDFDDPQGTSKHKNRCCVHAGALALAALMRDEEPPDCPHHTGTEAGVDSTSRRPLALNDDAGLAAALGLRLTDDPNFQGGNPPPAA